MALAWAALADGYHQLGHWGLAPPGTAYPRGKSAALKAIELDESLTEAQLALAVILKDYDWDFAGAEKSFLKAIEISPDHVGTRVFYSLLLCVLKRFDEALAEAKRYLDLDPLNLAAGNSPVQAG